MFAESQAPTAMFGLAPPGGSGPSFWSSAGSVPLTTDEPFAASSSSAAAAGGGAKEHRFNPYEFNGGTALGISGDDFAVVAADTRLMEGYSILSRDVSKIKQLTDNCAIATGGCYTDILTLHKVLETRVEQYHNKHESDISCPAVAQLLATTLYGRRFMPYYAFNVVAGIDAAGKGAVYTYDAVGSYERCTYAAQGCGQKLIIPLLDDLLGGSVFGSNRVDVRPAMTAEAAVEMVKEAFVTAGERDIQTGDAVEITVMRRGLPTMRSRFDLKKD